MLPSSLPAPLCSSLSTDWKADAMCHHISSCFLNLKDRVILELPLLLLTVLAKGSQGLPFLVERGCSCWSGDTWHGAIDLLNGI